LEFLTNINNKTVTVELNNKRGMKHTYMRLVSSTMIRINSNIYFTEADARDLIEKKKNWLEKNLTQLEKNSLAEDEFLFLGVKHKNFDNRDLDKFYRKEAQKLIPKIVLEYSKKMDLYPNSIKFRKNKRTWGSCNYKNELNFNTLLMKFPIPLIEYVVVHELAHIKHKNHSKNFWACVEKYCIDYKEKIKEFKSFL